MPAFLCRVLLIVLADYVSGTVGKGLVDKIVSVTSRAFDSDKDISVFYKS
jgi:hypothetical protein